MVTEFLSAVKEYVADRIAEFDRIPAPRKLTLQRIAEYVRDCRRAGRPIRLTFICTHNSRRSHLAQIWSAVSAAWYQVDGVETFSGGTEATAFAPQALAAIGRAGLAVAAPLPGSNPRYEVRFSESGPPLVCFSKVYDQPPNPVQDYCAVMTCSDADSRCPVVHGTRARIALPFDDPKVADGTPSECGTYDERCRQITRELLYAFSTVDDPQ